MARDYYSIGPVPNGEPCVQVGAEYYHELSKKECNAYINQLIRMFREPPAGSWFGKKTFPHDFGSYTEVCYFYDDENDSHLRYFDKVQNGTENWDAKAIEELGTEYFTLLKMPHPSERDGNLTHEQNRQIMELREQGYIVFKAEEVIEEIRSIQEVIEDSEDH